MSIEEKRRINVLPEASRLTPKDNSDYYRYMSESGKENPIKQENNPLTGGSIDTLKQQFDSLNKSNPKWLKETVDDVHSMADIQRKQEYEAEFGEKQGKLQMRERAKLEKGGVIEVTREPEDNNLYAGEVEDALEERINRIKYFLTGKNPVEMETGQAKKDGVVKEEDETEENFRKRKEAAEKRKEEEFKKKREDFEKRMNAVNERINREAEQRNLGDRPNYVRDEKMIEYFNTLKIWAKTITRNVDEGRMRTGIDKLILPDEIYKKLKEIHSGEEFNFSPDTPGFEDKMKEAMHILDECKFIDLFKTAEPRDKRGVYDFTHDYLKPVDKGTFGTPMCLEATMQLIAEAEDAEGGGWKTGGEHELIDANGQFHMENFYLWLRKRCLRESQAQSKSKIDCLGGINVITGMTNLSLWQMLSTPIHTQWREYEIKGDVSDWYKKDGKVDVNDIESGWGNPKSHEMLTRDHRMEIVTEVWQFGLRHSDAVTLTELNVRQNLEESSKVLEQIYSHNDYFRGKMFLTILKAPASKATEVKDYFEKNEAGSLGAAYGDLIAAFRYLTEFTDFYKEIEKKSTQEDNKSSLRENMFYKILEADGSSVLLRTIAEESLSRGVCGPDLWDDNSKVENDEEKKGIATIYNEFLVNRVRNIVENYKEKPGAQGKEKDLKKLEDKYIDDIKAVGSKVDLSFTTNKQLVNLQMDIKRLLKIDEILDSKGKSFQEGAKEDVKKEMLTNIGEFFDKLGKKKINDGKSIEEINKAKWEVNGATKTIGDIMKDYAKEEKELYMKYDEKKLPSYEQAVKEGDSEALLEYEKMFKRNEDLAFALLKKLGKIDRRDLNIFYKENPSEVAEGILKKSLTRAIKENYKLEEDEAGYVYDSAWYTLPQTLIAAWNNTSGSGNVNQLTSLNRTGEVRNAAMGGGLWGGNPKTYTEVRATTLPSIYDVVKLNRSGESKAVDSVLEVIQGGVGREVSHRWKRGFRLEENKSLQAEKEVLPYIWQNDYSRGVKLFKLLTSAPEMRLDNMVKPDHNGVLKFDRAEARKIFNEWWNTVRYVYDKKTDMDYSRTIAVDGREITIKNHMLGEETKAVAMGLREEYANMAKHCDSVGDKKMGDAYRKAMDKIDKQPGLAVFLSLLASEIKEHRDVFGSYTMYSAGQIEEMGWVIREMFADKGTVEWMDSEMKIDFAPPLVPRRVFNKALETKDISLASLVFGDLFIALASGLTGSVFDTGEDFWWRIASAKHSIGV